MARKFYTRGKRKYKPRKRAAATEDSKARSMQSSWRVATGKTSTLTIDDAKDLIKDPPICPYCKLPIFWKELSLDHVQPRSRGGADEPENIKWSCRECNMVKGNLTGEEFMLLVEFLDKHPTLKSYLYPRLKAGGAVFGRSRRWRKH